jgi:nitrogen regulatory protein PII
MAHLVVLVLDNLEHYSEILEAWEATGVSGITVLESTGLGRLRGAARDDMPLLPSLRDLVSHRELHHRTLFTVVEHETMAEQLIAATKAIIGDLSRENTGLLFVLPLSRVLGLKSRGARGPSEDSGANERGPGR